MARRIITNPKFIVERDGNDYVLKFRQGNIYKPIEFNNAQFSGKKNMVISQPNFSIIDDKFFVNINGHDVKIGEVGDGYTLASNVGRSIVEPNLDIVLGSNGRVSVVTEIGGKNITINGGGLPPAPPNSILYTVVEGGHKPESTWITENCTKNVFDANTGEGYLVLKPGVDTVKGKPGEFGGTSIFNDNEELPDSNVESVILPLQITSIGINAFAFCKGLTSVTIPNSVTSIGNYAFSGCSGLTSINIPDSVTKIGDSAFSYCRGLTSVTIPNSVTTIGKQSFDSCTGLTSVTIPNSVTSIKYRAFADCSELTSVTCLATTPPTLEIYIFDNIGTTECSVPADSITAYENSDWANYFTAFTAIQE